MAKPAAKDDSAGMERTDLKRFLKQARNEPVPIAFALGSDGKAIVQMDKRKPGRMLEKMLKEGDPDSKNHRWGTASVDPDSEKTIVLTVNKAGGGHARKLVMAFKGTGFSKVRLQLEDGSEVEAHEEEDEEGEAPDEDGPGLTVSLGEDEPAAPAAAAEADQAAGPSTSAAADEAEAVIEAGGAAGAASAVAAGDTGAEPAQATAPDAAPAADGAALAQQLTGLVKRMLGVIAKDPTQKAALTELATDAQASLKRNDLDQAGAGLEIFRQAIEDLEGMQAGGSAGAQLGAQTGAQMGAQVGSTPVAGGVGAAIGAAVAGKSGAPPAGDKAGGDTAAGDAVAGAAASAGAAAGDAGKELLKTLTHAVKTVMPAVTSVPGLGDAVRAAAAAVQDHIRTGDHQAASAGIAGIHQMAAGLPAQQGGGAAAGGQAGAGLAGAGLAGAGLGGEMAGLSGMGSLAGQMGGMSAEAMAGMGAPAGKPARDAHAEKHAASIDMAHKVWSATRKKVSGEFEKLHAEFGKALAGHGMLDELSKTMRTKVDGAMHGLDDQLNHTLKAINSARDADERAKHVERAHKLVEQYRSVASNPVIKMIDNNPFIPMGVGAIIHGTLDVMRKSIR